MLLFALVTSRCAADARPAEPVNEFQMPKNSKIQFSVLHCRIAKKMYHADPA